MISPGYTAVPDWFSWENQDADVAVADVTGNGRADLVVLMVDAPPGQNRGVYRIGRDLDASGAVTGGWGPWIDVPDWFSWENQGAGIAVADVTGNGRLDVIVLMVDAPPGQNRGVYRIGRDLDASGAVTGGWGPWIDVPDWFSWENQGAGVAIADVTGNGSPDLVVFAVDDGPEQNRGVSRVGAGLDTNGVVRGGWSPWVDTPDWFSWANEGGGVAVADVTGNGRADVVVFGIDGAQTQNQAYFRIAHDVGRDGVPAGGWSSLLGVNNWFSWENQGGGIAVADVGGAAHLVILGVDHPPGGNAGFVTAVPLTEDPRVHGAWKVEPFDSEVLAIHAALLHTGKVLFFAGSGNNTARDADPDLGDVAKNMWTSVVWDPTVNPPANFDHPATLRRADGKVFDFFCGGDTFLPDGTLLSAGGNKSYNGGNNLGQREVATFDAEKERWSARAPMAHGRWYPSLLPLADGRVLVVSGKNETDGALNPEFEVYDARDDSWSQLVPPTDHDFVGLPFYAHLFLLADGRAFFSGGRMDDDRPQPAGILDLSRSPVGFRAVAVNEPGFTRNQSASVILPPAQGQEVMIIGGGPPDDVTSATGSTERTRLDDPDPRSTLAMPLSLPRMHLNAVLLPDRTVFVSGGAIKHEREDVPPIARLQSEIYDPETDTWRAAAAASVVRMYHSVALLLPDGRVVTASGNPPPYGHEAPWLPPQANEELRIETYSPPYLFAGDRPTIGRVPTEWHYGDEPDIDTPDASQVLWAQLIRNGVTTHAFDNSQRVVDLPISRRAARRIRVQAPTSAALAPPGWYMLFLVDDARVPSTATWVHLT